MAWVAKEEREVGKRGKCVLDEGVGKKITVTGKMNKEVETGRRIHHPQF